MSPWQDAGDWVNEKFDELDRKGVSELTVLFDKPAMKKKGIETASMTFGRRLGEAVKFAEDMAKKGYRVLLAYPNGTGGFGGYTVDGKTGRFHECSRRPVD